jgi:release factor glutamine methyltransferase
MSPQMSAAPPPQLVKAIAGRLRAGGSGYAEDEARILIEESAGDTKQLAAMIERRSAGEPLQQILGWAMFASQRVTIAPGVFVPRRRTELLFLQAAKYTERGDVVLDMCCGAGAIGMALAAVKRNIELHCTDIDPVAVECADKNLEGLGAMTYVGDLFEPLPVVLRGRINVLVANAPHVPTATIDAMAPEAREYEARAALDGGDDGLDIQRRIVEEAPGWIKRNGALLLETSESQADALLEICRTHELKPELVTSEELDAHIVVAWR